MVELKDFRGFYFRGCQASAVFSSDRTLDQPAIAADQGQCSLRWSLNSQHPWDTSTFFLVSWILIGWDSHRKRVPRLVFGLNSQYERENLTLAEIGLNFKFNSIFLVLYKFCCVCVCACVWDKRNVCVCACVCDRRNCVWQTECVCVCVSANVDLMNTWMGAEFCSLPNTSLKGLVSSC